MNTVELLEAELSRTRERSSPSVIDLSELRFLDLAGLRALEGAVARGPATTPQLVGATGIVRRLIELAGTLDADGDSVRTPLPAGPTTTFGARNGGGALVVPDRSTNGARAGAPTASTTTNGDAT